MASYTPNINLKKPTTSEMYNVLDWNDNSDKIDTAIGNLNRIIDFFATQINYGSSVAITTKGGGNRAGIVVVGEGSSVSLWAFSYRAVSQAATIVKIGGTDNRTLSISVTSAGVVTITASSECHMDIMMSI